MVTPRAIPYTFITLLLLLLHALVPAHSLPVQARPSFAKSLDTSFLVDHDASLLKRSHATLVESSPSVVAQSPTSVPLANDSRPSSRLFARTFLDPRITARGSSPSSLHGGAVVEHGADPKLDRRWWVFDKIKQGFQNFGKKVKEGFQNAGKKIKEGFQNFGNKVKGAFQTAGRKIKEGFQTTGKKIKEGFHKFGDKVKAGFQKVKQGFQTAGRKIKEGFQTAGRKIKEGFQTAGTKIKQGFQTAGRKIKEGFQTAGKKMKEGFIKAGNWIKDTGAKVAKFGLKVWSTVQSVAAKAVKYILPGVGKPLSLALSASATGISTAADKIPVKLGDKLETGMKVMDKIQHPISGVAGEVLDKVLRRDLLSISSELSGRDVIKQEKLSRSYIRDLDERAWDGDFDLEERSLIDNSNPLGLSSGEGEEGTRSSLGVRRKHLLFRKDP